MTLVLLLRSIRVSGAWGFKASRRRGAAQSRCDCASSGLSPSRGRFHTDCSPFRRSKTKGVKLPGPSWRRCLTGHCPPTPEEAVQSRLCADAQRLSNQTSSALHSKYAQQARPVWSAVTSCPSSLHLSWLSGYMWGQTWFCCFLCYVAWRLCPAS